MRSLSLRISFLGSILCLLVPQGGSPAPEVLSRSSVFWKDNTCLQTDSPTGSSCKISEAQRRSFILSRLHPLESRLAAFLLRRLSGSMSHTCNHFRTKSLSSYTLGVFSRPSVLILGHEDRLKNSKSSSAGSLLPNNSSFSLSLACHILL